MTSECDKPRGGDAERPFGATVDLTFLIVWKTINADADPDTSEPRCC